MNTNKNPKEGQHGQNEKVVTEFSSTTSSEYYNENDQSDLEIDNNGSSIIAAPVTSVASYKDLEKFLEEGRRQNVGNDDLTPDKILSEYDRQRRWFNGLFCVACTLAFIILSLTILSTYFDLSGGNEGPPVVDSEKVKVFYVHFICMMFSIVIGLPFAAVLHRLFPNSNFWLLNYIHSGIYIGLTCVFAVGLLDMIIRHDHFNTYHFGTLHSWVGLLLTLMIFLEIISGCLFCREKYTAEAFTPVDLNVQFHEVIGELILIVSIGSWMTGMSHLSFYLNLKPTRKNSTFWNVIGILSFLFNLLLLVLIFNSRFRRRGRPTLESIYNNPTNQANDSSETIISKAELFNGVKKKIQKLDHNNVKKLSKPNVASRQ